MRFFLFSIVAFAATPPLIFAVLLLFQYSDSQRARAEQGLVESARGVARAIDAEFATTAATLDVLKDSTVLEIGDLEAFERRLRITTFEVGRSFALIDADGRENRQHRAVAA